MFEGESPPNYEQKCLCMLVVDASGSMAGEPINQLNKGLQEFHKAVMENFAASQKLEVSIVTFGSSVVCIQEPKLIDNFQMPTLVANGSTKLVEGVRLAMDIIENRKQWYKETGQKYDRPMIILITDGEPDWDQDVAGLSKEIATKAASKGFIFWTLGVTGYNHEKLSQICSTPPPRPLEGTKFVEFFLWLSNSIGLILNSQEGQIISLPSTDSWTQIQM